MGANLEDVLKAWERASNDEILKAISIDRADYDSDALEVIQSVVEQRGLCAGDVSKAWERASDDEILRAISVCSEAYDREALQLVRSVAEQRGLRPIDAHQSRLQDGGKQPARMRRARGGVVLWGGLLGFGAFYSVFLAHPMTPGPGIRLGEVTVGRIIASSSSPMKGLFLLGALMSVGICVVWYRVSRKLQRRNVAARLLAVGFFAFGSVLPINAFSQFAEVEVFRSRSLKGLAGDYGSACLFCAVTLFVGAVLLALAYVLYFRSAQRTAAPRG